MTDARPSVERLTAIFREGVVRVPASWDLTGAERAGLWWRPDANVAVATPALLRLARGLPAIEESSGLLLAVEPRFRQKWLAIQAARLAELGRRGEVVELCRQIEQLGPCAEELRALLDSARLEPTGLGALELDVFGAPADQSAAAPGLLRVLGLTAPLVEGKQGQAHAKLLPVDPKDPRANWTTGRLLLAPGSRAYVGTQYVLGGVLGEPDRSRIAWVLATPWATLLGVLAFMAEAWAAERRGGVQLELPVDRVESFAEPSRVDVIVTLADGAEVLCGTLGAFCLRVLDALGMALVPNLDASHLDERLGKVVGRLLAAGVWSYQALERPQYVIGERFSDDCYRGEGHRYIYRAGELLADTMRETCLTWARSLVVQPSKEVPV